MYLVTGGLGFIGNELVRQLQRQGESVVVLDNRRRMAPDIGDLAGVRVVDIDLTQTADVFAAVASLKPKVVIHLAAIHFIPECNGQPELTLRVNVEATLGLMRACVEARVEHFLLASSGAIYGDSPEPLSEDSPVAPVDIYGWSKLHAENLARWQAEQYGLRVTACRLFNNYGPRETNAHIIPEILQQLKLGDVLHLGNVKPQRDYIHTADTAKALRLLAQAPPDKFQVFNIASGHHASVEELVALMAELLGRPLRIETDRSRFRKADKLVQVAAIERLAARLNWKPEIGLRDGLGQLLRYEKLLA
ncbi:MAG: NAD(P)-dependent oxidoreductase [Verrucomicrobia bacterium]|nr:NAD(P)-dependent oxidoreductase [Verrucomicrobiota bacterium]